MRRVSVFSRSYLEGTRLRVRSSQEKSRRVAGTREVEVEKETCQPPCGLPLRVKHIEDLHRSITTIADELHVPVGQPAVTVFSRPLAMLGTFRLRTPKLEELFAKG